MQSKWIVLGCLLVSLSSLAFADGGVIRVEESLNDGAVRTSWCRTLEIDADNRQMQCWDNPQLHGTAVRHALAPMSAWSERRVRATAPMIEAAKAMRAAGETPPQVDAKVWEGYAAADLAQLQFSGGLWWNETSGFNLVFVPLPIPDGACDDATDCADAIERSCEATGQGAADTVTFSKANGQCEGSCDGGGSVHVECVTASQRPRG